jgi:phospholipid/cholesterol/gamma-HCH transport system permease protein
MTMLAGIGRSFLSFLAMMGAVSTFAGRAIFHAFAPPIYWRLLGKQLIAVGYFSLPVVGLTALFTGAVLARQIYIGTGRIGAESAVPTIVVFSITRELGPVIASLMVAGRVSAAMAAEIGTMRVSEQIDALQTLATNPFKYLVGPRVLATTLVLPALVLVGDVIGVMGGYFMATEMLGFSGSAYIRNTIDFLEVSDVVSGLVKAAAFGFLIALMGCFHGYRSQGGAQGVGRATTNAVVSSSILILAANYVITELFFAQ